MKIVSPLIYLLINFIIINCEIDSTVNKILSWYDYKDYNQSHIFNLMPIPENSTYTSNNTCVTYGDLIKYNYTDLFGNWRNYLNVYPENFCYSMLTYNISREDFFNIIDKNLKAFYNYRKLIALWTIYNFTLSKSMDDQCAGYFRNIACWTEFPACIDNGDKTWTASPICSNYCGIYQVRCGEFAVNSFCNKVSDLEYCAGYMSTNYLHFSYLKYLLILILVFI